MDQQIIYDSVNKYINDEIEKRRERISSKKDKIDEGNFFEKIRTKSDIDDMRERNALLGEFQKNFSDFYFENDGQKYEIPAEIMDQINIVVSRLEPQQASKINVDLDAIIYGENYTKPKREIDKSFDLAKDSSKKANLDSKQIALQNLDKYSGVVTISKLMDELKEMKYEQLRKNSTSEDLKPIQDIDRLEDMAYVEVDSLIRDGDFTGDRNMSSIKANYEKIKANMLTRDKNNKLIESIDSALMIINTEAKRSNVDYSKLIEDLNKYKIEANRKIAEANKYLSKFDLSALDVELAKSRERQAEESNKDRYGQLVYERAKAQKEGNHAKAEEIRKQMVAAGEGYSNSELMEMQREAKDKLDNNLLAEKVRQEQKPKNMEEELLVGRGIKQKEIEDRRKSINEKEEHLRSIAIERINARGISLDDENAEAIIQNEVEDISRIAKMSPAERRVADGNNNPNDDIYYSDEFIGFDANDVKRTNQQIDREVKTQATSIYKEYLKYYAKQEHKEDAIKFSEYALMYYNYANMNEQLVDEEVREEGKTR